MRCLCASAFLLLLTGSVGALTLLGDKHPEALELFFAFPTAESELARRQCLKNGASCDWCSLPTYLSMRGVDPIALVAPPGTGGLTLRFYLEQAGRMSSTQEECFQRHALGESWRIGTRLVTERCVGQFFYDRSVAVHFTEMQRLLLTPTLRPAATVFLLRNPLDAATRAWYEQCATSGIQLQEEQDARVSTSCKEGDFFERYMQLMQSHFDASFGYPNVWYEDVAGDRESALTPVLQVLYDENPDDFPVPGTMTHCVSRAVKFSLDEVTQATRLDFLTRAHVSPTRILDLCQAWQSRWNLTRIC